MNVTGWDFHCWISTSCPLWTCSDNCSGAAVCPALLLWRQPGSPGSPQTAQSPGGGRWCRPPPAWRPARTARSPRSDSMTRSGSSQSLKVHNIGKPHESTEINIFNNSRENSSKPAGRYWHRQKHYFMCIDPVNRKKAKQFTFPNTSQ